MNLKVSPNGNILVQYHNQTIEIDQSTDIIWIFPVLPGGGGRQGGVCVYSSIQFYHMYKFLHPALQSRY